VLDAQITYILKFYILLTVHLNIISGRWPIWRTVLLYITFISVLYMFRSNKCSSSGGQLHEYSSWYIHSL